VEHGFIQGIATFTEAQALSQAAQRAGKTAVIHLKIDTGMRRLGFRVQDIPELVRAAQLPNLQAEGIYTHFADADHEDLSFAWRQLRIFNEVVEQLAGEGIQIRIRHTASSAAILRLPEAHFELARPGIMLYGYPPGVEDPAADGFEPVLSWRTKISQVKMIAAGDSGSYGRTFRAAYPTRVATIPVGYADGLRRALSNRAEVLVRGERAALIGRVCMDYTMLDVTKWPDLQPGETVTLLGADGASRVDAWDMARELETISYEVICGISKRVPRIVIK
jgi:alanine racemase